MAGFLQKKDRSVIPRWRLFKVTTGLGELVASGSSRLFPRTVPNLALLREQFAANRNIWYATDLLSAAFVFQDAESGVDAAQYVLAHRADASIVALDLANRLVKGVGADSIQPVSAWEAFARDARLRVRSDVRDAIRWTDLGLAQTVLGLREKALYCVRIALHLAPDNRFVLRSAARCYLHWGDPERAHWILRKSERTKHDPWLLSAEIAVASSREQRSANLSIARRILTEGQLQPHSVSELAMATASVELEHSSKAASRFFKQALVDPTENTVAQMQWVFSEKDVPVAGLDDVDIPLLYEARAADRYHDGHWEQAIEYANLWYGDQPFSSRPTDLASCAAGNLGRFSQAVSLLKRAHVERGDDAILINNLSYFYLREGKLAEAQHVFDRINRSSLNSEQKLVVQATAGLIEIRKGNVDEGRSLYRQTIVQAWKQEHQRIKAIAGLNLAREEASLGNVCEARTIFAEANRVARPFKNNKDVESVIAETHEVIESMQAETR